MKTERCYICKGRTEVHFSISTGKGPSFNLLKCLDCRFLRIDPVPGQNFLDELYRENAMPPALLENEVFSSYFLKILKKTFIIKPLIRKLRNQIYNTNKPKLLDIGCSTGWITSVSGKVGFEVTGLEANARAAEFGRKKYGIEIIEGYIENLDTDQKYNAVTMFHVLEHITDPRRLLNSINALLDEKGKLLVVIPNSESLGTKIFKKNYNWNIPHHISFFSPATISNIFDQAGFRVLGTEHMISPPLLMYSYNKLMAGRKSEGKFSFKIKNRKISNLLFVPLSLAGKIAGRGEVIAVFGEKK